MNNNKIDAEYFNVCCRYGSLNEIKKTHKYVGIKKTDVSHNNYSSIKNACEGNNWNIISYLYNIETFDIEDLNNFIDEIPENKKKILLNTIIPLGSFTKPVTL